MGRCCKPRPEMSPRGGKHGEDEVIHRFIEIILWYNIHKWYIHYLSFIEIHEMILNHVIIIAYVSVSPKSKSPCLSSPIFSFLKHTLFVLFFFSYCLLLWTVHILPKVLPRSSGTFMCYTQQEAVMQHFLNASKSSALSWWRDRFRASPPDLVGTWLRLSLERAPWLDSG